MVPYRRRLVAVIFSALQNAKTPGTAILAHRSGDSSRVGNRTGVARQSPRAVLRESLTKLPMKTKQGPAKDFKHCLKLRSAVCVEGSDKEALLALVEQQSLARQAAREECVPPSERRSGHGVNEMIAPLEPGRRQARRERAFAAVGPWIGDCSHHTQKKVAPHRSHSLGAVNTVASLQMPEKLFKNGIGAKKRTTFRALFALCRIVVVGDTCVSEEGMATIVAREKRYHVCGSAHGFYDANKVIRKHQPDVLLIEPFLEERDGIRWIKDLASEFPRTRILVVSRQCERIYAERALHAGAAGYWMKNGSPEALLRALETVAAGEIYLSPAITSLAVQKFALRETLPRGVGVLSDRELAIFGLIAAEQGVGGIAKKLGISRTTVETHCQHIKQKLGYCNAEALKRGARELLRTGPHLAQNLH